ncbi:hypothetical protein H257_00075 [Aphanomyces astaci]|uniref:Uncharacterized protein n=1 Tax=Aphanomyces astaci TaxID=112090 RepID=W4HA98_APHAT|nr:hypothetical protein H257_00075 [Aphanomyces astaci]ETV88491.1 hypothetical protein H257_00075 [Aphanomyces astaci]|eukprot:XP_009820891.1 hypothetical protein H257_00075 [Aphanomyces astaci]
MKVMLLAADARSRYDKIGIWPLVVTVTALRTSKNRSKGVLELKPQNRGKEAKIQGIQVGTIGRLLRNEKPSIHRNVLKAALGNFALIDVTIVTAGRFSEFLDAGVHLSVILEGNESFFVLMYDVPRVAKCGFLEAVAVTAAKGFIFIVIALFVAVDDFP